MIYQKLSKKNRLRFMVVGQKGELTLSLYFFSIVFYDFIEKITIFQSVCTIN